MIVRDVSDRPTGTSRLSLAVSNAAVLAIVVAMGAAAWPVEATGMTDCNHFVVKAPAAMSLVTEVTGDPPPVDYGSLLMTAIGCTEYRE